MPSKTFADWLKDNWDEALVYVAAVASVYFSNQLDKLKTEESIIISFDQGRFVVSLIVGLVSAILASWVVFLLERRGGKDSVARAAKRNNFGTRVLIAMAIGFFAKEILEALFRLISSALSIGG